MRKRYVKKYSIYNHVVMFFVVLEGYHFIREFIELLAIDYKLSHLVLSYLY